MVAKARKAHYLATLIYIDEPHLLLLQSGTTKLLAVAIPTPNEAAALFLAVTVQPHTWDRYIAGNCDLRFLFTFPRNKILYYFDLMQMHINEVKMYLADTPIPEEHLPLPRIFADDHTNDWEPIPRSPHVEALAIDGRWEMHEFGSFYQKYADVYALIATVKIWRDDSTPDALRRVIKSEFTGKPFRGGFSYVHLFDDLFGRIPVQDRPSLKQVEYASPGFVRLRGERATFADMESVIKNYLGNRVEIVKKYLDLHSFLSRAKLLTLPGEKFESDAPSARFILAQAREFADLLSVVDFDDMLNLTNNNVLVAAKVVLAASRRIEDASMFFAEGRMAFSGDPSYEEVATPTA